MNEYTTVTATRFTNSIIISKRTRYILLQLTTVNRHPPEQQQQQQRRLVRDCGDCYGIRSSSSSGGSGGYIIFVLFLLISWFTSLLLQYLPPVLLLPTNAFHHHHHHHHRIVPSSQHAPQQHHQRLWLYRVMSQPKPPSKQQLPPPPPPLSHNNLRHRFQLYSTNKVNKRKDDDKDDDDDDNDDSDDMNDSKNAKNHTSSDGHISSRHHHNHHPRTQQHQSKKHSHSKLEQSLVIKRTKQLQQENDQLKHTIQRLQTENRKLKLRPFPQPPPQNQVQSSHHRNIYTKTTGNHTTMVVALERFEGDTLLLPSRNGGDDIEQCSSTNRNNTNHGLEHTPHEEMWCDTLDTHTDTYGSDGTCPIEPDICFRDALRDRAVWLVSLLILQSISGIILYQNELVLSNHPSSTCKK